MASGCMGICFHIPCNRSGKHCIQSGLYLEMINRSPKVNLLPFIFSGVPFCQAPLSRMKSFRLNSSSSTRASTTRTVVSVWVIWFDLYHYSLSTYRIQKTKALHMMSFSRPPSRYSRNLGWLLFFRPSNLLIIQIAIRVG